MKRKAIALSIVVCAVIFLVACPLSTWERKTFQSLSASKAVIDQAGADYNSKAIPNTVTNYNLIQDARKAQTAAVLAFHDYWIAKGEYQNANTAANQTALDKAKAAVLAAVAVLDDLSKQLAALPRQTQS